MNFRNSKISPLLIANRGEITRRIVRTCKRLGLQTVAVYSESDKYSLHKSEADMAYCIGAAPAKESYLHIGNILEAAKKSQSRAVHPGYGFLSESAVFAEAVTEAELHWIGPSVETLYLCGEKHRARMLAEQIGVPVIPGYNGREQLLERFLDEAKKIGFPLFIKAVAGGGGRGLRRVDKASELEEAMKAAKREGLLVFGNEQMILEKCISSARHIEVQIIGDSYGNLLHLFERDCSLQRRNQKVIEEAPASGLSKKLRVNIQEAALALGRACKLENAATVEFLIEEKTENFYFLEINPRLQVEHTVTEEVTGVDIVELQLLVAAGKKLPLRQSKIKCRGHAVQARVYAEVPARDFMPSSGTLQQVSFQSKGSRIEHALQIGFQITTDYDPLLAKVICLGKSREEALSSLKESLQETILLGVNNNLSYLARVLEHPAVERNVATTSFLDMGNTSLLGEEPSEEHVREASAIFFALQSFLLASQSVDAFDTLHYRRPFGGESETIFLKTCSTLVQIKSDYSPQEKIFLAETTEVFLSSNTFSPESIKVHVDGCEFVFTDISPGEQYSFRINNRPSSAALSIPEGLMPYRQKGWVYYRGAQFFIKLLEESSLEKSSESFGGNIYSPLPGRILQVCVCQGEKVQAGQTLIVIESMKMEHSLMAPRDGAIKTIEATIGDVVEEGELLASVLFVDK